MTSGLIVKMVLTKPDGSLRRPRIHSPLPLSPSNPSFRRQSSSLVVPPYRYVAPTYFLCFSLLRKHRGCGGFFPFWFNLSGMSEGNSSPSLITPTLVLSFHALRKCKFHNSFLFIFLQIGGGRGSSSLDFRIDVSFLPVNILLNEVECRVLGSLIEKEITTPEYYPLSLN